MWLKNGDRITWKVASLKEGNLRNSLARSRNLRSWALTITDHGLGWGDQSTDGPEAATENQAEKVPHGLNPSIALRRRVKEAKKITRNIRIW